MKLVVISSVLPPFRAAEADYGWRFCRELAEAGHEVVLLTTRREHPPIPGVEIRAVMDEWTWRELPRLGAELADIRPEGVILLYIGWMYAFHPMITFLPTYLRALRPRPKLATVFYNRYGALRKQATFRSLVLHKTFKAIAREKSLIYEYGSLLSSSERVFAFSRQHAVTFKTVHPPVEGRLELLPALPLCRFWMGDRAEGRARGRKMLGLGETDQALVFFGYVYPSKGIETLLGALARLPAPTRVVLLGGVLDEGALKDDGYRASLQMRAEALGVSDRVIWKGGFAWDSEEASLGLLAADTIVLPFDDGISLNNSSFATAAWHAQPVVSTGREDLEPEFRDGENILLARAKDPESLAGALERVRGDAGLRRRLAAGVRRLAESHFDWRAAIERVVAALG